MRAGFFERIFLPGLAFKAAVIGGGYATGRELASFFLPSGAVGGFKALALATVIWSLVCALTFAFAFETRSRDYRTFFKALLGCGWFAYEIAFLLALVVILAVFAAAAGQVGSALAGFPAYAGAIGLAVAIAVVASCGNDAVESLFKYVSVLLYGTYLLFFVLALWRFGDRISTGLGHPAPSDGWIAGGTTYAIYNIIGAIVILPVTRHLRSRRDAVAAGLLCGPLAMLPAALFFLAMIGFADTLLVHPLPSDFLLSQLDMPWFRVIFQLMILAAMLESGVGGVHAINERLSNMIATRARRDRGLTPFQRLASTSAVLLFAVVVADRVGLVALIADGYRWLAYLFLLVYVAPLLTLGAARLWRTRTHAAACEGSRE
ncbi:hypothetical protein [Sphingopyxis sp.]|uniref:YkvI family membrane protein n=1 Tax=Sphingopyxis sp. TaxID=1908224 RepID=UPI002ED8F473